MLNTLRRYYFKLFQEKILRDDFVARLHCSIVGASMMPNGNIFALDYAIQRLPKEGSLLEIGSFGGMSANIITYFLQKYQQPHRFFTCDPWIYEGFYDKTKREDIQYMKYIDGSQEIEREQYTNFIKTSFLQATRFFSASRLPHSFQFTSDEFFANWRKQANITDLFEKEVKLGGSIAFAYIDGDHSYQQAKRDFENVYEYLTDGGFILLDDSADFQSFGSAILAREIAKSYPNLKLVMKNPHYLWQKIKS
ncbi:MAG: class I SAM-dependent methyltransferase [Bacteroidia bacterium]